MDRAMQDLAPISRQIWDMKYRFKRPAADVAAGEDRSPEIVDQSIEHSWRRVATALAEVEAPAVR